MIGLMDAERRLDPVVISSCIFLEDESAKTTVESILAKVSEIDEGWVVGKQTGIEMAWRVIVLKNKKNVHIVCLLDVHLLLQ
jgi:hypothetical protein